MCQVKTRTEVAYGLGITLRTLERWLKKANIELPKGRLTAKSQAMIQEKFGSGG